jgi:hypothetical protein
MEENDAKNRLLSNWQKIRPTVTLIAYPEAAIQSPVRKPITSAWKYMT